MLDQPIAQRASGNPEGGRDFGHAERFVRVFQGELEERSHWRRDQRSKPVIDLTSRGTLGRRREYAGEHVLHVLDVTEH